MGFKELIERMRGKTEDKESLHSQIKDIDIRTRAEETVVQRKKSANERELERYYEEENEAAIKKSLEFMRKKRQHDIDFGHNPLHTKNVMKSDWEILKDKQLFKENNMFNNQKNIFKDNPYIFK